MFAAEFEYRKAGSIAEAVQLLADNPDAKILAGGHSLIPLMRFRLARPETVIDIGGIAGLKGVTVSNGTIRIGALTTHAEIANSAEVEHANGLLAEAARGIGDPAVRNRGTIGGNLAHADPSSDWGTVLTALGASVHVQGPSGSRTVDASDFIEDAFATALADNEIITTITVPTLAANQRAEYAKMAHPASFYSVVGGAVVVTMDGDRCTAASVAVGGLTPRPVKAPAVEAALTGMQLTADNIATATAHLGEDITAAGVDIIGDIYASAGYRAGVAPVEVKHALMHAIGLAHH